MEMAIHRTAREAVFESMPDNSSTAKSPIPRELDSLENCRAFAVVLCDADVLTAPVLDYALAIRSISAREKL